MTEFLFSIAGFLLIGIALAQFAMWTGRIALLARYDKKRFEAEQALLREQLETIRAEARTPSREMDRDDSPTGDSISDEGGEFTLEPNVSVAPSAVPSEAASSIGPWSGFRPFRVARLVRETDNATSVWFQPESDFPLPDYQPGQHITLRIAVPGHDRPLVRCYTLSDDQIADGYRITVKRLPPAAGIPPFPGGVVSNHINSTLAVGDTVELKPPSGKFFLESGERPLVLLAGGIGITPMMSILNRIARSGDVRQCLLVYAVTDGNDLTFASDIERLVGHHRNIHVMRCFANPTPDDIAKKRFHIRGRIDAAILKQVLPGTDCDFYMCGPPPFMQSLYSGLTEWGVPDDQIRFEAFGPASVTRSKASTADSSVTPSADSPELSIQLAVSGKQLHWNGNHTSLLELLEAEDVVIDSGCRAGNCGTCETRLLKGRVQHTEGAEPEPGYCLPCVAVPLDTIELEA